MVPWCQRAAKRTDREAGEEHQQGALAIKTIQKERRRKAGEPRTESIGGHSPAELGGVDPEHAHQLRTEWRDDDEVDGDAELHQRQDGKQSPLSGSQARFGGGSTLSNRQGFLSRCLWRGGGGSGQIVGHQGRARNSSHPIQARASCRPMYSVGMRIPTGTGAFVGGSQSFGQPAVPEAQADKLQLLENYLPGLCPARMRLPTSKLTEHVGGKSRGVLPPHHRGLSCLSFRE